MTITDWIQLGLLVVALGTLIFQQHRANSNSNRTEKRIANKLKIFYICQAHARTEEEIIREFKQGHPTEKIDEVEVRKTIYEMLSDETLRFRDNQTYRARRNKATTPSQDEME
jgi:hypothetical protein